MDRNSSIVRGRSVVRLLLWGRWSGRLLQIGVNRACPCHECMDRGLSCEAEAFFSWGEHEHEWTGTPAELEADQWSVFCCGADGLHAGRLLQIGVNRACPCHECMDRGLSCEGEAFFSWDEHPQVDRDSSRDQRGR